MPVKKRVAEFIRSRPMPTTADMDSVSIEDYRAAFDRAIEEGNKVTLDFENRVERQSLPSPLQDLAEQGIVLRVYTPEGEICAKTLILFAGTGFVHNNPDWNDKLHRALAFYSHCRVFVIAGRVAPEYQFPIGLDDSFDTLKYIISHAGVFGINPRQIGLGGFSSGGNFAALATIRAVQEEIPIAFQVLMSPFLDLSCSSELYKTLKSEEYRDYFFGEDVAKWLVANYLPLTISVRDPRVSPFWVDLSGLSLPPTFLMAAEFEPLRDDVRQYTRRLQEAGVPAEFFLVEGQIHEYLGCQKNRLVLPEEDPILEVTKFIRELNLDLTLDRGASLFQQNSVLFHQPLPPVSAVDEDRTAQLVNLR